MISHAFLKKESNILNCWWWLGSVGLYVVGLWGIFLFPFIFCPYIFFPLQWPHATFIIIIKNLIKFLERIKIILKNHSTHPTQVNSDRPLLKPSLATILGDGGCSLHWPFSTIYKLLARFCFYLRNCYRATAWCKTPCLRGKVVGLVSAPGSTHWRVSVQTCHTKSQGARQGDWQLSGLKGHFCSGPCLVPGGGA